MKAVGLALTVEYALRGTSTPFDVSEYEIMAALPETLRGSLPTVTQFEAELNGTSEEPFAADTG